jgi:hypothetical protein
VGDDDERIELATFTLAEAEAMIAGGAIRDAKTLVAILFELRRGDASR